MTQLGAPRPSDMVPPGPGERERVRLQDGGTDLADPPAAPVAPAVAPPGSGPPDSAAAGGSGASTPGPVLQLGSPGAPGGPAGDGAPGPGLPAAAAGAAAAGVLDGPGDGEPVEAALQEVRRDVRRAADTM